MFVCFPFRASLLLLLPCHAMSLSCADAWWDQRVCVVTTCACMMMKVVWMGCVYVMSLSILYWYVYVYVMISTGEERYWISCRSFKRNTQVCGCIHTTGQWQWCHIFGCWWAVSCVPVRNVDRMIPQRSNMSCMDVLLMFQWCFHIVIPSSCSSSCDVSC